VQPLLISSIFVVVLVAGAFALLQLRARRNKGMGRHELSEFAGAFRGDAGHVIIPSAVGKVSGKAAALATKQQQAAALETQVDDTIRRLILMKN